jgi:uncharacterized protein (TIGR03000 family)
MFRKLLTVAGVFGLAVAGLLLTSGPAGAQWVGQGWPIVNSRGGGGSAPSYSGSYSGPGYIFYGPGPSYPAPSYSYGSFSPEQTAAYYGSVVADREAVIDVRLPAGAVILFGGQRTTSTGPERRFVSPPLVPGKEYVYEVTVRWQEGGREVTRNRSLPVRAGERLNIAFGPEARQ